MAIRTRGLVITILSFLLLAGNINRDNAWLKFLETGEKAPLAVKQKAKVKQIISEKQVQAIKEKEHGAKDKKVSGQP